MAAKSLMDPQPSLAGGDWKPNQYLAAPQVNSVDSHKNPNEVSFDPANTPNRNTDTPDWVQMARNAYDSSESWLQVNARAQWATNFAHYRGEHAPNSPIFTDINKYRSRYFWPKTRTLVRDIQAAAAAAYFTSLDVLSVEAEDQDNKKQADAATYMKSLANYRLTNTIPWYLIVLGGMGEAAILGTVASHQSWLYREEETLVKTEVDPETGDTYGYYETKVLEDKPQIRIVPAENIRMSPAADWLDPANSSPYLIELMPMYAGDVMTRIREGKDPKSGEPAWKNIGMSGLMSAGNRENLDTTRRARAGSHRLDPKSNMMEVTDEFRIIWIHRNLIRYNGTDWLYYTAGPNVLLSDPVPLSEVIPWAKGKRDYVLGKLEVETDRPYPAGPVELVGGMQRALNELKNQRYDNVRQVLNRRYLYRQGTQVDIRALARNVPGGLVGVSAPGPLNNHVEPLPVQDVTASAYQEEDRLNLSFDDLSGSMTGNTVNSARRVNETATGMSLMNENENRIREMEIRTFTETWMKPVLQQLVELEAAYETDKVAMVVSAKKAKLRKVLPEYFDYTFAVTINVGMGAVSPQQRLQKLQTSIATVTQLVPDAAIGIRGDEVAKEVFGAAGYANGERFFDFAKVEKLKQNPQPDMAQQLAQQQLQQKAQIDQAKLELENQKLQLKQQEMQFKMQQEQATNAAILQEYAEKINLLLAKTAQTNVTAVYEAAQAQGVIAQNPGIASGTDQILKSSGFKDHDAAPVASEVAGQQAAQGMPGPTDTHPNLAPMPKETAGAEQGIETQQLGD